MAGVDARALGGHERRRGWPCCSVRGYHAFPTFGSSSDSARAASSCWGLSGMVPVLFSAACSGPGSLGPAIAAASMCGFLGIIGERGLARGIAEVTSLPAALWLLPCLTLAAVLLGRLGTRPAAHVDPGMMASQEPMLRREWR